uniref:Uncharacterized protein n=1 Tax=Brassica campestris TaxID=3711 RepID=M4F5N4_BRACM
MEVSMKPEAGEIFTAKIRILSGVYQNYSANQNGSGKIIGMDRRSKICRKDQNQTNGPRSSRWLIAWNQNVVSTVQQSECLQKLKACILKCGRRYVVLHEAETCSQPGGARGAAAQAFGSMRSDTRAATNLKLIG